MNSFDQAVINAQGQTLRAAGVRVIQVNLGLRCNLTCRHCHVEGGPQRAEVMTRATMQEVVRLAAAFPGCQVDLTGGAPELNPDFRWFVATLRGLGHPVQVRTNLVVYEEAGQYDTPEFLAGHQVQLVASLPCYLDQNVDRQRGAAVYQRSMTALRRLNLLGYGRRPELALNLVYNPGGAFLPPRQDQLEADYRRELRTRFGVEFTRLLTITNMPLGRFLADLQRQGRDAAYLQLLQDGFNPGTLDGLMCRHQLCIAWDGRLADCDFNQVLGLGLAAGLPRQLAEVNPADLATRPIVTAAHCFGCTAGCGSSCGGALVA